MKNIFTKGPILMILISYFISFISQSHAVFIINKSHYPEIISLMSSTKEGARIVLKPGECTTFTHPNLTSIKRTLFIAEIDTNPGDKAKLKRVPDLEGDPDLRTLTSAELRAEVFKLKNYTKVVKIYNLGIAGSCKMSVKKETQRYKPFEEIATYYDTSAWNHDN